MQAVTDQNEEVRVLINLQTRLVMEHGADRRREIPPTRTEAALTLPDDDDDADPSSGDILLTYRRATATSRPYTCISPNNAAYMPLHYALLFPHGEHEWFSQMPPVAGPLPPVARYPPNARHHSNNNLETCVAAEEIKQQRTQKKAQKEEKSAKKTKLANSSDC